MLVHLIVKKGNLFFFFHSTSTPQLNQTCCDAAADERPGHCRLQRAGSESQCLISMLSPPSTSPPSRPALMMKGRARRSDHQKCTNEHKKRLCRPFSPTSNVYQGTGITLSKNHKTTYSKLLSKCGSFSGA